DELSPPLPVVDTPGSGEPPRERRRLARPPVVEEPVERQRLAVEGDVLGVRVADAGADRLHYREGVHPLPEEVARVQVRRDVRAQSRGPLERLDVVDARSRMKLEADQEPWMLLARELAELRPVGRDAPFPLPLEDSLQVGQPATGGEVGDLAA